jgi:DNA replication protein DnaC
MSQTPIASSAQRQALDKGMLTANLIPLLVTSNLDLDQIAERWPAPFGESVASRLYGHCTTVAMSGNDRRGEF